MARAASAALRRGAMELEGQVAVVTGAASGIGAATAALFAREGATVVLADMNAEGARAQAATLRAEGLSAEGQGCDVTDWEQAQALLAFAESRFGGVDVLLNAAGILREKPFLEMEPSDWEATMQVNLNGVFYCSLAAARQMARLGKRGRIVSVASLNSYFAGRNTTAYNVSKAGVLMLTRSMAVDLAPHGIVVNAVAPGWVRTPMTRFAITDEFEQHLDRISPSARVAEPDDIARAVLYLSSPRCTHISGHALMVDGGQSAMEPMPI
jgi:NAD(P)-dependent dehydrogenase (short-subunit alcohol dehydrogenase family)